MREGYKMIKLLNFKSLRIKILFGFGIVIMSATLLSVYTIYSINKSNSDTQNMMDEDMSLLIGNEQLAINMAERTSLLRGYLLSVFVNIVVAFYNFSILVFLSPDKQIYRARLQSLGKKGYYDCPNDFVFSSSRMGLSATCSCGPQFLAPLVQRSGCFFIASS